MLNRSDFDWNLFDRYRADTIDAEECDSKFVDGKTLLHLWEENKGRYLADMFPAGQLIMERPIRYERDLSEMRQQMCDLLDEFHKFQMDFRDRLRIYMDPENKYGQKYLGNSYWNEYPEYEKQLLIMENIYGWFNINNLIDNEIRLPYHCSRYELDLGGHKLMLQQGMKLMKTLGKVCGFIGLEQEFEQFRIRQSQVTNAKIVTGTACLSIHPLDFATASDNDSGWSSCMSWREHGCYRMGTVEMMNSRMVLCAYIKSDKQFMSIADNDDWNSKKWRAWIIVNPQTIMVNRHYPFHSEPIAKFMVEWVRELVTEKLGWHYEDGIASDLMGYLCEKNHGIHYWTNFMYNDVSDDDVGVMTTDKQTLANWHESICFSGPAQCMWCGEEIPYEDNQEDADTLGCKGHRRVTCQDCGCEIDEGEVYEGPNGELWCSDCYHEHCEQCSECGSSEYKRDLTMVTFPFNEALQYDYFENHKNDEFNPIIESMRGYRGQFRSVRTNHYYLCDHCLKHETRGIPWVHLSDETESWEIAYEEGVETVVPDATQADLNDVIAYLRPSNYSYMMDSRYTWDDYTPEQKELAKQNVQEFYRIQWEALKNTLEHGRRTEASDGLPLVIYEGE